MKNVLIIDDDEMYQLILKRTIMRHCGGVEVHAAHNGKAGMRMLAEWHGTAQWPDVILLDINMPIMDGWEFLEAVHETYAKERAQLNIRMISTSLDVRDRERADTNIYVREFICKPVSEDKLKELIG